MSEDDKDVDKFGEPLTFDKSFKGPLEKRSCTDVVCLLIFIVFLVAWAFVAFFAITQGDLKKLLVPTDSMNRKCGVDSQVLNKPYLFFFNLEKCIDPVVTISGCPTPQICVQDCPKETFVFDTYRESSIQDLKNKLICIDDVEKERIQNRAQAEELIKKERCARWYVKSVPFQKRCTPSEFRPEDVGNIIDANSIVRLIKNLKLMDINGLGQKLVEDILNSWTTIFVALIIAMIVSLIFIAIMRWIAGPMVWLSIIGILIGLLFSIYIVSLQYIYWRDNPTVPQHSPHLAAKIKTWFQDKTTWLVLDIAISIIFVILFLIIICLRNRIKIAIALIKEGSKAVSSVFLTVFFPIIPWCLQIATLGFAIIVGLYLASMGESTFKVVGNLNEKCICTGDAAQYVKGGSCIPEIFSKNCHPRGGPMTVECIDAGCYFDHLEGPTIIGYLHAYNVIGFFWLMFFISAFGQMVLASTFATWYWSFHKSDVPFFTITRSLARTVRYHLGTLVFGALIITICRLIRIVLEFIDTQLKKYDNPITRAILCCMKCFFWCLENFLRFINKNAYIMCAIHGKNFCTSAKDAFNLLMRNVLRVITVDKVTDFCFFLSKLLLTAALGAATYFYIERVYLEQYELHYNWVPTAIVVIVTYLITTVFFGVYSMAIDTLFLCFLEDSERNDGSPEKPYYMSKNLMKILGKRNEIPRHHYR